MKKFLFILLFVLLNCSHNNTSNNKHQYKIALFTSVNTAFVETLVRDIESYSSIKYKNISIKRYYNYNPDIQRAQIREAILNGVDAILLQIADINMAPEIDKYIKSHNIPLVYFNIKPTTLQSGTYTYVGVNENIIGYLQVLEVLKVRKEGNAVILTGNPNNEASTIRTGSVIETLSNTKIKLIDKARANWYENLAFDSVINWFDRDLPIDIIFANNDDMAIGAINAIRSLNKRAGTNKGDIVVVGVDATYYSYNYLLDGSLYSSIVQDSKTEARIIVDTIVNIINNIDDTAFNPSIITVDPYIINASNVDK